VDGVVGGLEEGIGSVGMGWGWDGDGDTRDGGDDGCLYLMVLQSSMHSAILVIQPRAVCLNQSNINVYNIIPIPIPIAVRLLFLLAVGIARIWFLGYYWCGYGYGYGLGLGLGT
jgi:hypothetical protein